MERRAIWHVFGTKMVLNGSIPLTDIDYEFLQRYFRHLEYQRIKNRFEDLRDQWMENTKYESSATKIVEHPCYQEIIETGESMIPFILREVRTGNNHWFYALRKITGYTPRNAGKLNFDELRLAWMEWSEEQGKTVATV